MISFSSRFPNVPLLTFYCLFIGVYCWQVKKYIETIGRIQSSLIVILHYTWMEAKVTDQYMNYTRETTGGISSVIESHRHISIVKFPEME